MSQPSLRQAILLLFALALVAAVSAHPGEHEELLDVRSSRLSIRSLTKCSGSTDAIELGRRSFERRMRMLEKLRREKKQKRDGASVLAKDHKSNLTGITSATTPSTVFGSALSCILEPDVTQGPYYIVGEYARNDVRESQAGVDLYVDIELVDVNTCTVVPDVWVDFWHCNSTGVYSGIVANGNGNSQDSSNLDNTFLRGIAKTGSDGVVQFVTKFPGHYTGRTNHIHVLSHASTEIVVNGSYVSATATATHVGQIFFDQSLVSLVEAVAPYSTNTQQLTQNSADNIFSQSAASFDPVVNYALLGNSVSDGIFAWISMGIDTSKSSNVQPARVHSAAGAALTSGASASATKVASSSTKTATAGTSAAAATATVTASSPSASSSTATARAGSAINHIVSFPGVAMAVVLGVVANFV
ncbi:aromatic compound dioxygenase [Gonapodya prolifera JEL478]|uniref:Aromatic compound dioxygenase n=1 Tax=Gonapodya prolifera (strain JEL478) TaxID=1344416 RepID=A0A139AN00_GONPJ|nr:aromatic compound dioxygenase [Gonapodya prolifera JEL478]|eukprot:KXS17845.1 aromatic compound dioxygenase [Gonapodya prolifera JEL478]